MTWTSTMISVLIALTLYISLFLYMKSSRRKFSNWRKSSNAKFMRNIRENWKRIKVDTDNCTVINFNTKVNKNSPGYSLSNTDESFIEWISDHNRIELVDVKRSKVICRYIDNEKVVREFFKIVDVDKTVVEFKIRMRDYIYIYFPEGFEEENYIVDLDFLSEEVDLTKFESS